MAGGDFVLGEALGEEVVRAPPSPAECRMAFRLRLQSRALTGRRHCSVRPGGWWWVPWLCLWWQTPQWVPPRKRRSDRGDDSVGTSRPADTYTRATWSTGIIRDRFSPQIHLPSRAAFAAGRGGSASVAAQHGPRGHEEEPPRTRGTDGASLLDEQRQQLAPQPLGDWQRRAAARKSGDEVERAIWARTLGTIGAGSESAGPSPRPQTPSQDKEASTGSSSSPREHGVPPELSPLAPQQELQAGEKQQDHEVELQARVAPLRAECDRLRQALQHASAGQAQAEALLARRDQTVHDLRQQNQALRKLPREVRALESRNEALELQVAQLLAQHGEVEAQLRAHQEALASQKALLVEAEARVASLQADLAVEVGTGQDLALQRVQADEKALGLLKVNQRLLQELQSARRLRGSGHGPAASVAGGAAVPAATGPEEAVAVLEEVSSAGGAAAPAAADQEEALAAAAEAVADPEEAGEAVAGRKEAADAAGDQEAASSPDVSGDLEALLIFDEIDRDHGGRGFITRQEFPRFAETLLERMQWRTPWSQAETWWHIIFDWDGPRSQLRREECPPLVRLLRCSFDPEEARRLDGELEAASIFGEMVPESRRPGYITRLEFRRFVETLLERMQWQTPGPQEETGHSLFETLLEGRSKLYWDQCPPLVRQLRYRFDPMAIRRRQLVETRRLQEPTLAFADGGFRIPDLFGPSSRPPEQRAEECKQQ